jgi:hypothetical protein
MSAGNQQAGAVLDVERSSGEVIGREGRRDPCLPGRFRGGRHRAAVRSDERVGRVAAALLSIEGRLQCEPADSRRDLPGEQPSPSAVVWQPPRAWQPRQGAERRDYPRHPSGCRVAVCRTTDSAGLTSQQRNWKLHATPIRGELADISLTGAAFWLDQELGAGEDIYIRLSEPKSGRTLDVPARVLRSEPLPAGADHNGAGSAASAAVRIVCVFRRRLAVHELREFSHACLPPGVV